MIAPGETAAGCRTTPLASRRASIAAMMSALAAGGAGLQPWRRSLKVHRPVHLQGERVGEPASSAVPALPSGEQPQRGRPGNGLGTVGRAELAQDMAYVLLDRVERDHELTRDGLVRPARRQHLRHFQLAAGQRVDDAGRRYGAPARFRRGMRGAEGALQPGQVAEPDAGGGLEP
jgi:hypothetical protein